MSKRKVVKIDEEKCNGCGLCVPACTEGAIQIIDGKARLVSETYCDGLGDCLGECPEGAITLEEREAENFDPQAVEVHLEKLNADKQKPELSDGQKTKIFSGCPGAAVRKLTPKQNDEENNQELQPSQLGNWPVQLNLLPVEAPYLKEADLLISADCVPFALAGFHNQLLKGKVLMIGCPKLDNTEIYFHKLIQIFSKNNIKSIEVAYMEVPCCFALVRVVEAALAETGKKIPLKLTKVGIQGGIIDQKNN